MPYTQEGRLISLTSPLGDDKLLLTGFTGHEAISRLFHFHLTTLSDDDSIDFTQIVGQNVTVNLTLSDDSQRYFNGVVSHFGCTGNEGDMIRYEMEVVPQLWTLTRYADCRIFHNKDVTEIVKGILDDRGITYQASLTGTYNKLEYCVQYRETDFNFISRLMEQYGIFYFFQHDDGDHTMMLGDSSSVFQPCPGPTVGGFNIAGGGLDAGDVINSWSVGQELRSGKCSVTDYNFTTSSADLAASESTIYTVGGNDSMEIFDFPGLHLTQSDGTAVAKLRMAEEEAVHKIAHGASVCRVFSSGYTFELTDHPVDALNDNYLFTEIQHVATVSGTYGDNAGGGGEDNYSNHFTAIPADVVFRPARVTPKPFVQGPQTAVVVGKSADQDSADDQSSGGDGEEIWVDKWGRVLVLFPWDRAKATSCWVRVSQDWAGQGWGMINIPRVGQEVIVSFLEGDPDRPIITGRVYNDVQLIPYKLPDHGTITTFRTSSSTGGGTDHYNELRFEDKTGKEQVFVRAEYDQDNYVKHDTREWIGNNRSLVVTTDQMDSIGGDYHEQITGKNLIKIGGDRNEQVGGKEIIKIGGDRNEQVGGAEAIKISSDANHHVSGNWNQKTDQTVSIQAGMNMYEKSGQNYAHQAGQMIHLKAGMTVVIEAGMELTLKAGSNFIDIGPSGIAISGTPMVMINSGGAAGSGCGSSPTSPTDPVGPTDPKDPDLADDGKSGTKRGSGLAGSSASSGGAAGAGAGGGSSPASSSSPSSPSSPASPSAPSSPSVPSASSLAAAAGQAQQAGQQAASQVQQTAQQATQQAAQVANQAAQAAQQAAGEAKQAAGQAQQAAQQAEQQAQQAVQQAKQQASQAFQQAQQAVQQAQQQVQQAAGQAQQQAQQVLNQVQQEAQQAQQQAAQAVQQAQQQAQQVQQQAQQAANQAQQAAQQAEQQAQQAEQQAQQAEQQAAQQAQQAAQQAQQQAQQAVQQAQQQGQQAIEQGQQAEQQAQQGIQQSTQQAQQTVSQAEQQAQQAAQQAKQAAQQAQQQAQQAAQQAQQAAQQAQQQAQQAQQQAQQAAKQVQQSAQQAQQQAQQSAQQAQQSAQQAISQAGHGI